MIVSHQIAHCGKSKRKTVPPCRTRTAPLPPTGDPGQAERVIRPKQVPLPEFGVVVFESRHAAGFVGELQDGFSKFLLIVGGKAHWQACSQEIVVSADSLVHVPAGVAHVQTDIVSEPVTLYAAHYRPDILPEFLRNELPGDVLMHWNLGKFSPLLARSVRSDFQEMLFEEGSQRQGWEWVVCSRLLEVAIKAFRMRHQEQSGKPPLFIKGTDSAERVARYAVHLKSRFHQRQTLDEAAVETGLSRRQFTDMFRKVTGESWKQHLHRLRLQHGHKLLLETNTTVTAAAFESGFEDLSYFNHAFKKAYGSSPQSIRRKQKGD